ncbi:Farnesol kinase, chloroplastic [Vitis vinifera]|uniref:Farnesol kinase, chloroplastic n=1 Tax=Vitis vinifera TaxID=29760 RepID=A0A438G1V2_VITVI|nr:Farnesol kinase, chloroplastic [Vitis vinifera]
MGAANFNVSILRASAGITYFTADFRLADRPPLNATFSAGVTATTGLRVRFRVPNGGLARGGLTSPSALMLPQNPVAGDICAAALTGAAALSLLRFWGEIAKRGFFDQTVGRKLVHISVGLVFMLFWPLFSSGRQGAVLAALIPGVNIIRMLLLGLGMWKDEATVKSMSRHGDHSDVSVSMNKPVWGTSQGTAILCLSYYSCLCNLLENFPIAIAAICNLCAGDGLADLVGRRFGIQKIPYNRNKSFSGSLAMAVAGFLASIGYMHYFASFGFIQESWEMVFGFLVVSLGSTLVESLPISSELDDNLTIPVTSLLLGTLVF